MKIGSFDSKEAVLLIAEVGNNHEGRFDVAQELVKRARDSGAQAVKFQTFKTELFQSPTDAARFARLKSFELTFTQFEKLAALAQQCGLMFISTPLDLESAKFLGPLVDSYKIASGDNNFLALLDLVADTAKPVILSTGASDLGLVQRSVGRLKQRWSAARQPGQLGVLHCVTSYPAPPEQANLRSIEVLANAFPDDTVGYSDHIIGLDAALAAVALGARIVEKHFTLAHDYSDFRDHLLSADPTELAELARRIPVVASMRGRADKVIRPCEEPLIGFVRRSAFAASDLAAGHRLTADDLRWLRPGTGVGPSDQDVLLGKKLTRAVPAGQMLQRTDVD